MRHLILITALMMPLPAAAQVQPPETLLEQLERLTKPLLPMLRDLGEQIEKLPNYHPPEVLPNGDIIIRRKSDPETPDAPQPEPKQLEPLDL
jgi:hypothetical protein